MSSPEAGIGPAPPPATSIDGFLGGRFHLVQPQGRGHRAGADALLVAAAVPQDAAGAAVDLGSGAGAVGFAIATRCPALSVTLVEIDTEMAALARLSRDLPQNARLKERLKVVQADATARRSGREAAGLRDGAFDIVATNPPFHPTGQRSSPDPQRAAARSLPDDGFLARWIVAGAALLRPGGVFAMIARPENLAVILSAAERRLGDLRLIPVHASAGKPAIRILVRAHRASRAPVAVLPGLVLHQPGGAFTPFAAAVFRGECGIGFDS